MRVMYPKFVKFAAYLVLAVALSASAFASCGDSLAAMAAQAASIHNPSRTVQPGSQSRPDQGKYSSIVGLWHIRFVVNDQTIQEAFQLWNTGGTEVHNPNVDPRSGNVCLGVWKRSGDKTTYTLTHRVWNYDSDGNFGGTINLSETISLGDHGTTHSGSFTLDFYDPSGNFLFEVPGNVVAERIPVQ